MSRPCARQHPPGRVEQEALPQTIVAGNKIEATGKVDRPELPCRADAFQMQSAQHIEFSSAANMRR